MNERLDGTGYPRHLEGDSIGIHARILAVANAFTAINYHFLTILHKHQPIIGGSTN